MSALSWLKSFAILTFMKRAHKRRGRRQLNLGMAAATLLVCLAVVALTGLGSLRFTLTEIETRAEANLAVQTAVLERLLDKFRLLSPLLARGPEPGRLAVGEGSDLSRATISVAAGMSGAEEIWLLDPQGRMLFSSRDNVPHGSIGGSEVIPDAFYQAAQGQLGRELIPGTPDRPASYVFASPLRAGDQLSGVLAVRVGLGDVEQAWALSKDPIVALDAQDRVVVSNLPAWRNKPIASLDLSRSFAGLSILERLAMLLPIAGQAPVHLELVKSVPVLGWQVRTLADVEPARRQSGWAMLIALLACVIAAGGIWLIQFRRRELDRQIRRDKAAALRLERRVKTRTAELRTANRQLEQEVRERLQAEADLRQMQAELVQAAKLATLGRMSAALSHEYNQPLAAIRSDAEIAEMLIDRGRAEEAKGNLTRIGGMVSRMAELAKTLKGFTRKSGTDIKPVSMRQVVDEAMLLLQPQIKQSKVALVIDLPPENLIVGGGRIRLEQVVINLLANALDAVSDHPQPKVSLTLVRSGGKAVMTVRDNGTGISEDVLPQIFDPFFTTKSVGAGLGLGLSIAYKIVHDFAGSLSAANDANGGAVFTMSLPLADENLLAAE